MGKRRKRKISPNDKGEKKKKYIRFRRWPHTFPSRLPLAHTCILILAFCSPKVPVHPSAVDCANVHPEALLGSGTVGKCDLVGGGWVTGKHNLEGDIGTSTHLSLSFVSRHHEKNCCYHRHRVQGSRRPDRGKRRPKHGKLGTDTFLPFTLLCTAKLSDDIPKARPQGLFPLFGN